MKCVSRSLLAASVVLAHQFLAAAVAPAGPAPFQVGGPGVNPAGFRVTTFADGLNFPYGMVQLSDGSLLVATSAGSDFFFSPSQLVRLVDTNNDGAADGPATPVFTGLPNRATALAQTDQFVFVATGREEFARISILRKGAAPTDALMLAGQIDLTFTPQHAFHQIHALAVRPAAGGGHELFFNIGSSANETPSPAGDVTFGGDVAAVTGNSDSIYRVKIEDAGASISATNLQQIAAGLRNAAGMAFHPVTGDLYFQDNGFDGGPGFSEPTAVDELNRLAVADIGGAVEDFGFAHNYIAYRTGIEVGSGAVDPIATFQPLNNSESEGATLITFAPEQFPDVVRDGIFLGFHGMFFDAGLVNEENPLIFVDPATGQYFHFVDNDQPVGHLDGILASADSLFLADFSRTGLDANTGAIYQIQALGDGPGPVVPLPAALYAFPMGACVAWWASRRIGGFKTSAFARARS